MINAITYYSEALLLTKNFTRNLSAEERNHWRKTSVAVGILSLGIIHALCAVVYVIRHFEDIKAKILPPAQVNPIIPPVIKPIVPPKPNPPVILPPDVKSALFEIYSKERGYGPEEYQKVADLFPQKEPKDILCIERQARFGDGFCALYAVNNALQKSLLQVDAFSFWHALFYQKKLKLDEKTAENMANDFGGYGEDFGVDPQALMYIIKSALEIEMKQAKIADLIQDNDKKSALDAFVGNSSWAIIANVEQSYRFPIDGRFHVSPLGHFTALRKDDEGTWWFVDSVAKRPFAIDLFLLPEGFTILAPLFAE